MMPGKHDDVTCRRPQIAVRQPKRGGGVKSGKQLWSRIVPWPRILAVLVLFSMGTLAQALPPGVIVLRDLAYGPDPAQKLDVYRPSAAHGAPVLFLVHGGAWMIGDKANADVVDNKLDRWVPRGVLLVSVNYRMLPAQMALGQADDVAKALAFAQAHAAEWGGDPRRFVVMGHSAGAHLVALLAADPARAKRFGAKPWLGTVVLDSAALDVPAVMARQHFRFYDRAFGADPAQWRSASPLQALTATAPPMLLVCSQPRRDDSCAAARTFAERAHMLGVRAEVLPQDLGHGEINRELGLPGAYTDAVERFMASLDGGWAAPLR
jgi:acetyl esterase/lipase